MTGVVYTETVVFAAPAQYAAEAPYQIAIVDLEDGTRRTVRIFAKEARDRVQIGDHVTYREEQDGIAYYCKRL
ncbi:MAG TPA: OB-fold domain-containing protein [Bryobacteraceae bacterium]